jgi:hypothetical protein
MTGSELSSPVAVFISRSRPGPIDLCFGTVSEDARGPWLTCLATRRRPPATGWPPLPE